MKRHRCLVIALACVLLASSAVGCDSPIGTLIIGSIFGIVTLNGAPAEGVTVVLFNPPTMTSPPEMVAQSRTDAAGSFNFFAVPVGTRLVAPRDGLPADAMCSPSVWVGDVLPNVALEVNFDCTAAIPGTISGTVLRNDGTGVPATVGADLTTSPDGLFRVDFAAPTAADGSYVITEVPFGEYFVLLTEAPAGLECTPAQHVVVVQPFVPAVVADFSCFNPSDQETRVFIGVLSRTGGDLTHDPFVFNAGEAGKGMEFNANIGAGNITLFGSTSPSALPTLSGPLAPDGSFSIVVFTTIAGIGGVEVRAEGRVEGNALTIDLHVGGNGVLPNGTPISYRFEGVDPLGRETTRRWQ